MSRGPSIKRGASLHDSTEKGFWQIHASTRPHVRGEFVIEAPAFGGLEVGAARRDSLF